MLLNENFMTEEEIERPLERDPQPLDLCCVDLGPHVSD
jgi:hypothetical protein